MPENSDNLKISLIADAKQLDKTVADREKKLKEFQKFSAEQARVRFTATIVELQQMMQDARKRLADFKKKGDRDGEIKARLDIIGLQKGITQARQELGKLQRESERGFLRFGQIFKDFAKGFLLFNVASGVRNFFRGATQSALEFDIAFRGVRKTVDATEPELAELRQEIEDMSRSLGIAAPELARIAELGGQLGIPVKDIKEFTKVIAEIAVATNLSSEEAAVGFARIANITGLPKEKIENLASSVVDLGNKTEATEKEIVDFAIRLAGAGRIADLTDAQIVSFAAAFSSVGVEAELGGTAVSKALLKINAAVIDGGEDLRLFAKVSGLSSAQFAKAWREDAGKAFAAFILGLTKSGDNAGKIIAKLLGNNDRLQRVFLSAAGAGEKLNATLDIGTKAFQENTALSEENRKRQDTLSGRLEVQKQRWEQIKRSVGEFTLLAIVPLIDKVFTIIDLFKLGIPEAFKAFKVALLVLFPPLGLLITLLDKVIRKISEALTAIAGFQGAFDQALTSQEKFSQQLGKNSEKSLDVIQKLKKENEELSKISSKANQKLIKENEQIIDLEKSKARTTIKEMEIALLLAERTVANNKFRRLNDSEQEAARQSELNQIDDKINKLGAEVSAERKAQGETTTTLEQSQRDKIAAIKAGTAATEESGDAAGDAGEDYSEFGEKGAAAGEKITEEMLLAREELSKYDQKIRDTTKRTEQLGEDTKKFYKEIRDAIGKAADEQARLNKEIETFRLDETTQFVQDTAQKDVELSEQEVKLQEELNELKEREKEILAEFQKELSNRGGEQDDGSLAAQFEKDKAENLEEQKKTQEEINKVLAERGEITKFIAENEQGDAFKTASELAGKSQFEQSRQEFEKKLADKEAEIQAEIEKQQKIIKIQETFLKLQLSKEREFVRARAILRKILSSGDIDNLDEFNKFLADQGITELTQQEQLDLLQQAEKVVALENERRAIESQQQEIFATKQEYIDLAEIAFSDSVDRQKLKMDELIDVILRAQKEQLIFNQLRESGATSLGNNNSVSVNIGPNNISKEVDGDLLVNKVRKEVEQGLARKLQLKRVGSS